MTAIGWIQILLYCTIIVALAKPLGGYMTHVFNGERTFLSPILRPVEAGLYWIGGVDEKREQHWLTYTVAMLLFHVGGFLIIYGLMRLLPQTSPSTPRSPSLPTPTGKTTVARARCPISCRCSA
jgi:K+-transporting ATPase ATPase A chain